MRRSKILAALLLICVLAATPATLFASPWEEDAGQVFFNDLVELVEDFRADWAVHDINQLVNLEVMDEEMLTALLEMGLDAALAYHMEADELEYFMGLSYSARFWYLYDYYLSTGIWVAQQDPWAWEWTLSPEWDNEGAAFMAQLVEILGEAEALWLAEELDWMWISGHLIEDEDAMPTIFALDIADFLPEVDWLTADDISHFWDELDYTGRMWVLLDVFMLEFQSPLEPWVPTLSDAWDDEGAALMAQLDEILGDESIWFADEIDWMWITGLLSDEDFFEILEMDMMEMLAERLTPEEMDEFFEMDYTARLWLLEEIFLFPLWDMIWEGGDDGWGGLDWDNPPAVYREHVEYWVNAIIREYTDDYDFDILPLLAAAGVSQDELVDALYMQLTLISDIAVISQWTWGDAWLYYTIEEYFFMLSGMSESNAIMDLRFMAGFLIMANILGENLLPIFELDIFYVTIDLFGMMEVEYALFINPYLEELLTTYGAELLTLLDFDIFEALGEFFETGEIPRGLSIANDLFGGLLADNADALYDFYTAGPPEIIDFSVFENELWRSIEHWESVWIEPADFGRRMEFDVEANTEFAIDFWGMDAANLNLFFQSQSDYYTYFLVETLGAAGTFFQELTQARPNGRAVLQLPQELLEGGNYMVWVLIVGAEDSTPYGEFALRKTHYPLGYE